MGSFEVVSQLAARQRGLVELSQAVEAGVPQSSLRAWVSTGRLVKSQPRVYRVTAAPTSYEQSVLAATLSSGGTAAFRTAASLWGLLPPGDDIDILVPRGASAKLRSAHVHRFDAPIETMVRRAIPVTTPPCTLVMLGAVCTRADVETAAGEALVRRLVTIPGLHGALDRLGGSGRRGAATLRGVLREWERAKRPPDSVLELRMNSLLKRRRLPAATFQYRVIVRGRALGRVDFAYPDYRIAIEVDGGEHHSLQRDRQRDAIRRNAITNAGWAVIIFTWLDVTRRADYVAATIRAQLRSRRESDDISS